MIILNSLLILLYHYIIIVTAVICIILINLYMVNINFNNLVTFSVYLQIQFQNFSFYKSKELKMSKL